MDEFGPVGVDGGECEQLGEAEEGCDDLAEASGVYTVRFFLLYLFFFSPGGRIFILVLFSLSFAFSF